jgi:nucleoside 2-deoxyribosyltransferase
MNTLSGTRAYTVGNLEFDSFASAAKWRQLLSDALTPIGVQILSPLDNVFKTFAPESAGWNKELKERLQNPSHWDFVHEEAKKIRNRDLCQVDISTFIVAVLNPDKPTFGTTDEIITAKRACKPVFLVIPDKGYSGIPIWLASYFKPNWVYSSIDEVIQELYRINNSPVEDLNNKYWKILK